MNTQGNKLIAEFMGFEVDPEDSYKVRIPHFIQMYPMIISNPMVSGRDYSEWADSYNDGIDGGGYCLSFESLEFDKSWDWLMPVVEKIEKMLPDDSVITISYKDCIIPINEAEFDIIETNGDTKLDATYDAVVKFIEWYNENK